MIARLKNLFATAAVTDDRSADSSIETERAVVTLLFMAAMMDDHVDDTERAEISKAILSRFDFSPDEIKRLMAEAEVEAQESTHFLRFTSEVKGAYDDADRARVVEMLWRVICADGVVHDREANLMRRIAGLLYVTDKDSGLARQRALASIDASRRAPS